MKGDVKTQWLAALRSGKYTQGQRSLNKDDRFCCLGVLCDLAVKAGIAGEWIDVGSEFGFELPSIGEDDDTRYESEFLPPVVAEWAGLDTDPRIGQFSITAYNDGADGLDEFTFDEIADLIERRL